MRRLSQLLRRQRQSLRPDVVEEPHFMVGGRYELLQPMTLLTKPDLSSNSCGILQARHTVLLLALQAAVPLSGIGEVLLAYLANTKQPEWISGWGQIEGPPLTAPMLQRRRLRGSWEVGGRYRVDGSPVLRAGIELESDLECETQPGEEVLVLELALVLLQNGEPRLRAHVRSDNGKLGWLTIELPGGSPLLSPLNLYSEDEVRTTGRCLPCMRQPPKRASGQRLTLSGVEEGAADAWQVGGKYCILMKSTVRRDAHLDSEVIGSVRPGMLIYVLEVRHAEQSGPNEGPIRLHIESFDLHMTGWIRSTSSTGEAVVDVRDHLEYDKLLNSIDMPPSLPQFQPQLDMMQREFSVRLTNQHRAPLGVMVDQSDGQSLLIKYITEGGIFKDFNVTARAEDQIGTGDRIISVNGVSGSADALLRELTEADTLDLTLLADCAPSSSLAGSSLQDGEHWSAGETHPEPPSHRSSPAPSLPPDNPQNWRGPAGACESTHSNLGIATRSDCEVSERELKGDSQNKGMERSRQEEVAEIEEALRAARRVTARESAGVPLEEAAHTTRELAGTIEREVWGQPSHFPAESTPDSKEVPAPPAWTPTTDGVVSHLAAPAAGAAGMRGAANPDPDFAHPVSSDIRVGDDPASNFVMPAVAHHNTVPERYHRPAGVLNDGPDWKAFGDGPTEPEVPEFTFSSWGEGLLCGGSLECRRLLNGNFRSSNPGMERAAEPQRTRPAPSHWSQPASPWRRCMPG